MQLSASESVRVRSKVSDILRLVAGKSAVGKNAVCNAILSAPEQSDMSGSAGESISARKIAFTKLRWQLSLRLELLYEFLVVTDSSNGGAPSPPAMGRRKSTSRTAKSSSTSSEPLGLVNVVPFLGSCVTHPSPLIRTASAKFMRFLRSTSEEELTTFCSRVALQLCRGDCRRSWRMLPGMKTRKGIMPTTSMRTEPRVCVEVERHTYDELLLYVLPGRCLWRRSR